VTIFRSCPLFTWRLEHRQQPKRYVYQVYLNVQCQICYFIANITSPLYEGESILEYCAMQSRRSWSMFHRWLLPPSSGRSQFLILGKWYFTCCETLRHGASGLTSSPKKGVLRNFIVLNPSRQRGFNPRTLGPLASTLTITPPRRLRRYFICTHT
jgi:hypothetical protein